MPASSIVSSLQYHMIRHGADYGSSSVDGSNLLSELDPSNRNDEPVLKRFFLRDGAYQWMHIIKVSAEWTMPNLPVSLFGEAGTIISYFTNIDAPANITGQAHPYKKIDTTEYPKSNGFVVKLGVRIYPH